MIKDPKERRDYAMAHVDDGIIPVYGDFDPDQAEIIIDCIQKATKNGLKEVKFHIDSNGGWNDSCNAIVAKMAQTDIRFVGIVMGKALSNGLRLLMHCDWRMAYGSSTLLFHWGRSNLENHDLAALMDQSSYNPMARHLSYLKQMAEEVSKRSGLSLEVLHELARYNRNLTAQEAKDLGLIDEILDAVPKVPKVVRPKKGDKKK